MTKEGQLARPPKEKSDAPTPRRPPGKQFIVRDPMLIDMLKVNHIQGIYNLCLAFLFILELQYTFTFGKLDFGLSYTIHCFGKLPHGILVWVLMNLATICGYGCYRCWASQRHKFAPASRLLKLWDYGWLVTLVLYQLCFFGLPACCIYKWKFGKATTVALTFEQMRIFMKSYALVRSNAPKVIAHKSSSETSTPPCPEFSHFIYFLFAPTLLYRDSYPRTQDIRWRLVLTHLLEMVACVIYISLIFELWVIPTHQHWGLTPASPRQIAHAIVSTSIPMSAVAILMFYLLFHAWSNAAAEVMRFGDRMFYEDWWNARSIADFFRKWNMLVQDWIYEYLYQDIRDVTNLRSKPLLMMSVFLISGLAHDYVIALTLGFFNPVLGHLFIPIAGANLLFLRLFGYKASNVVVWVYFSVFVGGFFSLQAMETFARVNCVWTEEGWQDYFSSLKSWNCTPIPTRTQL